MISTITKEHVLCAILRKGPELFERRNGPDGQKNEAPHSKLWGIKAEFAVAYYPPSLQGALAGRHAFHPCSKLQGIQAKANKPLLAVFSNATCQMR